jgi:hypothetical protein
VGVPRLRRHAHRHRLVRVDGGTRRRRRPHGTVAARRAPSRTSHLMLRVSVGYEAGWISDGPHPRPAATSPRHHIATRGTERSLIFTVG